MSDPQGPVGPEEQKQAAYVAAITSALIPAVQKTLEDVPPPQGSPHAVTAAFIQAFAELTLSIADACGVHRVEVGKALMMVGADIQTYYTQMQAAVSNAAPPAEPKVDF